MEAETCLYEFIFSSLSYCRNPVSDPLKLINYRRAWNKAAGIELFDLPNMPEL